VIIDGQVIFVSGQKLRELIFDERNAGFRARDITILSEHILDGGIRHISYQQDPDSVIWVVRNDGQLVGFTFEREQEVIGAHRHILGGSFGSGNSVVEDVAVIPTPDLTEDQVWLVVKRTIDGNTVRYIEYINQSYRPNINATSTQQELIDAVGEGRFCDSFIFGSGIVSTTVTGLDHLEGEEVVILSDGAVHPNRTVSSGEITLERIPANGEVVVGLRELCRGMTQRFLVNNQLGSSLGFKHLIQRLQIFLYNSIGFRYGSSGSTQLDEVEFRGGSDPMDQSPPLIQSGFVGGSMPKTDGAGGWTQDPVVYFESDQPLPLTVLAISVIVEENKTDEQD
jgi:hypothetical protein